MNLFRSLFSTTAGIPNTMAAQEVRNKIAEHPILIFSKSTCPHCTNAKKLLKSLDATTAIYELDEMKNGQGYEWQNVFPPISDGERTVPNIFIGGHHIEGGNSGLQTLHRQGLLVGMIAATKPENKKETAKA